MERGDPGSGAGAYLTAMLILGVIDEAMPPLAPPLWSDTPHGRVKLTKRERGEDDAHYF